MTRWAKARGTRERCARRPSERRQTVNDAHGRQPAGGARAGGRLTARGLGVERLGARATFVQFSTAFCQPCRATRRILREVGGMVEGVLHIEIDAEQRLDLVRELGVARTPTVLVLDASGRVVRRAAGAPRKVDVIAALGAAVG
jgi:thiol-disulfide isomerase/thioredoxin